MFIKREGTEFIYTFACQKEEQSLSLLEMRSLFGEQTESNILKSTSEIDPSRSPFIKERIEVIYEGDSLQEIVEQAGNINMGESTFKVIFIKINDLEASEKIEYEEQRLIEREIGWEIKGEADVRHPDHLFGIVTMGGRWYFGNLKKNEALWLQHMKKPQTFSTALSTRVARAVANIAVPKPDGVKAIDPCCGIGTVLVEALSMGIDIVGRDINPLVTSGSRENIAFFGYEGEVGLGPISDVTEQYDVAIIDLPYNLYTHATREEQFNILNHARRIARKSVIITIETIDDMIMEAGYDIKDRCVASKGKFSRQVLVCE
ncbi:TRM11 family SAM-dependent methyltransferase [Cytobacillus massiliigabonensis]|uniref:TRM11 family SAM-dependent methyltransferase n=1 Tax=Cytobacillus massiliigabonensis TaxID=1871011 RepID=UPI001F19B685|nr:RNA methyltransferase [Cytobacillus massiliigabonensis]